MDNSDHQLEGETGVWDNPDMKNSYEKAAAIIMAGGWASALLSVALYLLFWRVDNEPGAIKAPELLQASLIFLAAGGLAFIGGNIYLLTRNAWKAYRAAWLLCAVILLLAMLGSPLLLMMLV